MVKNSLLIVVSLVLTLAGLEIYLRISVPQRLEPTACRTAHNRLHHFFKPSTSCRFKTPEWDILYTINSLGLRDKEYPIDKQAQTYRVLITGDSFTEGFGVEDNDIFVNKLEVYLNQTFDYNFEVINVGVSSWSATPEYLYLKNYGLQLSPDLVVLVATISDFSDEYFYERAMNEAGLFDPELVSTPSAAKVVPYSFSWEWFKTILRENLKIYRFFSLKLRTVLGLYDPVAGIHRNDIGKVQADQMAVSRTEEPLGYSEALTKLESRLKQIAGLMINQQTDFLLVLLPHPHMINGEEWSKGRQHFGFESGVVYSRRGWDDLAAWADEEGIDNLDLTAPLQVAAMTERLYFNQDGHLNAQGHTVVAKALHTYLTPRFSR